MAIAVAGDDVSSFSGEIYEEEIFGLNSLSILMLPGNEKSCLSSDHSKLHQWSILTTVGVG